MATVDKNRYNLLFRPVLKPERNYRSEAVFEEPDVTVGTSVPEETIDDVLQDLKDLEEISQGLPEGLEPVNEIVTKLRQRAEILKVEEELVKIQEPEPEIPSEPVTLPSPWGPSSTPIPVSVTPEPYTPSPVYRPGTTIVQGQPSSPVSETIGSTPSVREVPANSYSYKKTVIPKTGTIIVPEDEPFVPVGTNITDDEAAVEGTPVSFVPVTNIKISVETPKTLVEIAQDSYKKDQIDLQKFYLQKMRMALQRYFHHLLGLTAELSLSNPDMLTKNYDGDYVTGISSNCQHLHDTIIRSQIQRLQKARIFKKMANADQTVTHMRSWNAAEKERERYYQEAYGNSDNFIDSESNALLRQARSDYDANYKLALYNMYKYLDASVKLTEDILDHTLTEAKAKAKLIKEGIDIFKTEEVKVSNDINAVQKLQPKTQEQVEAEQKEDEAEKASLSADDIDKARGIEDPDLEFDLAPSGGHYSKNDIEYLCNMDPDLYNRNTAEGREAIKTTLNYADKYAAGTSEEESGNSSEEPVNQSEAASDETAVTEKSKQKVEEVVSSTSDKEPDIIVATQTGEGPSTISESEVKPTQEKTTISKQDQINVTIDGITYTLTAKYVAYPYTKGNIVSTTEGYDATATVRITDNTGKVLYIAQAKNGEPTKSASSVKKAYNNDSTTNQLIDKAYEMLTVKFWE